MFVTHLIDSRRGYFSRSCLFLCHDVILVALVSFFAVMSITIATTLQENCYICHH